MFAGIELVVDDVMVFLLFLKTTEEDAQRLNFCWNLCEIDEEPAAMFSSESMGKSVQLRKLISHLLLFLCILETGCASTPNSYRQLTPRDELRACSPEVEFEFGEPNVCLDSMQVVAELPSRLILGGRLKADRAPTVEAKEVLTDYLQENGLSNVPVLVNQYDPAGQWQRLRQNDRISPGWKYTAGTCTVIAYTLIPGRVIGRDTCNPFTDSLSINSGRLSDSLHAAAYAKDIHNRDLPGTYAVVNSMPVVSLWKTTRAVNDVVAYAQTKDSWQLESGVYRDQYPQVAVKTLAPAGFFVTPLGNLALAVSGGAVGYAVGRTVEQQRLAERNASADSTLKDVADDEEVKPSVELVGHSKSAGHSGKEVFD